MNDEPQNQEPPVEAIPVAEVPQEAAEIPPEEPAKPKRRSTRRGKTQEADVVDEQLAAREQEASAAAERGPIKTLGRPWSERYIQPVKYRMFTAKDASRDEKIMFVFGLPAGQTKPDEQILEVMRKHKQTEDGYQTGLRFENDPVHGKVWKLPNTPLGRDTAASIDQELKALAQKMEERQAVVG